MEHAFVSPASVRELWNAKILAGTHAGNMVFIPRIPLSPSSTAELPFDFRRTQFPLRLAFAMTINKAQGQTLKYVGLCLTESVFTHGQLYVAVSRVTDGANLRMIIPDTEDARKEGKINDVVYSELQKHLINVSHQPNFHVIVSPQCRSPLVYNITKLIL
jgi:Helicase